MCDTLVARETGAAKGGMVFAKNSDREANEAQYPLFAPAGDKVYRHPTFYAVPDDVPHM